MPGQNHGVALANLDDLNRNRTSQYFPSVVTCPLERESSSEQGAQLLLSLLDRNWAKAGACLNQCLEARSLQRRAPQEGQLPRYNLADSLSSNPVHLANCTQGALILALPAIASPEDQGISLCTRWRMGASCENAGEAASLGKFNGSD